MRSWIILGNQRNGDPPRLCCQHPNCESWAYGEDTPSRSVAELFSKPGEPRTKQRLILGAILHLRLSWHDADFIAFVMAAASYEKRGIPADP